MRSFKQIGVAVCVLAVSACGSDGASESSTSSGNKDTTAGSGVGSVTLNGVTEQMESWPTMCGPTRNGSSFIMRGGSLDGDDNPGNNTLNLSIGGEKEPRPLTSIVYNPPGDDTLEESVTLTGDDAVWMDGLRFTWKGETRSGKTLEVDIECP